MVERGPVQEDAFINPYFLAIGTCTVPLRLDTGEMVVCYLPVESPVEAGSFREGIHIHYSVLLEIHLAESLLYDVA